MSNRNKLDFILSEIKVLTGLTVDVLYHNYNTVQLVTPKRKTRIIDLSSCHTRQDLTLYSRLVCLELTA